MTAWFKSNKECGACSFFTGSNNRVLFGVETSADLCGTFADYNSIVNHNRADRRIGKCLSFCRSCEAERPLHVFNIIF